MVSIQDKATQAPTDDGSHSTAYEWAVVGAEGVEKYTNYLIYKEKVEITKVVSTG